MWQLQRRRYHSRANFYDGGISPFTWEPEPGFSFFSTRRAAVRAYLERMEPDLQGTPDAFLAIHWRTPFYRSLVRVVRISGNDM